MVVISYMYMSKQHVHCSATQLEHEQLWVLNSLHSVLSKSKGVVRGS